MQKYLNLTRFITFRPHPAKNTFHAIPRICLKSNVDKVVSEMKNIFSNAINQKGETLFWSYQILRLRAKSNDRLERFSLG